MSLLAEASALARRPGGMCAVPRLMRTLSPSEQAELTEALESSVSARAVGQACRDRGWDIPDQTIQRHRVGSCACRP